MEEGTMKILYFRNNGKITKVPCKRKKLLVYKAKTIKVERGNNESY